MLPQERSTSFTERVDGPAHDGTSGEWLLFLLEHKFHYYQPTTAAYLERTRSPLVHCLLDIFFDTVAQFR